MAVTMKYIAELAGVSIGTVDRALNNRGRIAPNVKARILKIAEELNYKPNSAAKSLAIRNRNLKITIILHIQKNDYYDEVIHGIEHEAESISAFGISVEIKHCPDFDYHKQLHLIDQAVEEKTSAIALVPINHPDIRSKLTELDELGIPVVLLNAPLPECPYLAYVGNNYAQSGRIAAGLINLITGGRANLAVFTPSLDMLGHRQRLSAFENHLQLFPELSVCCIQELSNTDIDSYKLTQQTLDLYPNADAILYMGAAVTGGIKAIQEASSHKKFRTVFFDTPNPVLENLKSGMIQAVISQNPRLQGELAIQILSNYLLKQELPTNKHCYIESRIIIRESIAESFK